MIKNNQFFMNSFSSVVIFGQPQNEIIQVNKRLKLSTTVITSEDQSKNMNKKFIYFKVFNSIDKKCIKSMKCIQTHEKT